MDPNAPQPDPSTTGLEWLMPAEPVSVRTLQEHLSGRSGPEVLAQLSEWLKALRRHDEVPLERWLEAIEQIDKLAELHQFRLVPQHLEAQRLRKLGESELWQATLDYWAQLDATCLQALERGASCGPGAPGEPGRVGPSALVPLLTRLMHNLARQHKSLLLNHQRIDERIWRDLGLGWRLGESLGLTDPAPRQEMLKLLMLAMAAPDALAPIQLHVAERLTACLAGHFAFNRRPGPSCGFCFDPDSQRPPTRRRSDAPSPAGQPPCCFGAGSALPALQGLAAQLRRRGGLPPQVALGGEFPPADILAAIRQLEQQWADVRPARRAAREAASTRLTVLPGLMPALGWLAQQQREGRLEPPRSPRTEHWEAIDRSESGFGTTLPAGPPGWLNVGALLAVLPQAGTALRMGVVRRITADPDGRSRIGVELLGQQAARVTLHPDLPRQDVDGMPAGQAAVLLSPPPGGTDQAELLLPAGIFEHAASLHMLLDSGSYRLESPATLGQGRDYRQVRYRLSRQA